MVVCDSEPRFTKLKPDFLFSLPLLVQVQSFVVRRAPWVTHLLPHSTPLHYYLLLESPPTKNIDTPPHNKKMEDNKEQSKSALKKAEKQAKWAAEKAAKAAKQAAVPVVGGKKQDDIIGITVSKAENFPAWYQEVVLKAEMVEYYQEISGFFVLRPLSMHIWATIRKWFTNHIEEMGVEETSFPLFLSAKSLEKEKDHVEGFAPELAWVTKAWVAPLYSILI